MATVDLLNPILNQLVTAFRTIVPASGYLTDLTNATIERCSTTPTWTTAQKPYIGVLLEEDVAVRPEAAGYATESFTWRCEGTVLVCFVVDASLDAGDASSPAAGETAAIRLVQDLMRAIALDVNLAGKVVTGMIGPGTFSVAQDTSTGTLLAGGILKLPVTWEWQT